MAIDSSESPYLWMECPMIAKWNGREGTWLCMLEESRFLSDCNLFGSNYFHLVTPKCRRDAMITPSCTVLSLPRDCSQWTFSPQFLGDFFINAVRVENGSRVTEEGSHTVKSVSARRFYIIIPLIGCWGKLTVRSPPMPIAQVWEQCGPHHLFVSVVRQIFSRFWMFCLSGLRMRRT